MSNVEQKIHLFKGDFHQLDDEFEDLQSIVENAENNSKKYNIRITGLEEGIEGGNLREYLVDFFTSCFGSDSDITVQIINAYHLGPLQKSEKKPRDILIKFPNWFVKTEVQEIFRNKSGLTVEGIEMLCFLDFSIITI